MTLTHVAAENVGGWSSGRLDFREVALTTVAEDVSRSTGARLTVAPELADRLFTGTLRLDRPSDEVIRSLAALADGATVEQVRDMITTGVVNGDVGKLAVFAGVHKYPARVKCAILSWHALIGALKGEAKPVSTENEQT